MYSFIGLVNYLATAIFVRIRHPNETRTREVFFAENVGLCYVFLDHFTKIESFEQFQNYSIWLLMNALICSKAISNMTNLDHTQ